MNTRIRKPDAHTSRHLLLIFVGLTLFGCSKAGDDPSANSHADHDDPSIMAGFIGLNHSHGNPGETCFICDPSKRDKGRLWCREHGRYEDRCWACHPELEETDRLFCREHALYEDECHLCHPELKDASGDNAPETAFFGSEPDEPTDKPQMGGLFCNEHRVYERECGICQPDLAGSLQPGESLKVRFATELSAQKAGIRSAPSQAAEVRPMISVYCETEYNLNALARITPLVDGIVQRVYTDLGELVEAGEPLVDLHSAAVADAKSAYLSALVTLDTAEQAFKRLERLDEEKIAAEKDLIEARGAYRSAHFAANTAHQRLINMGMSEHDVELVKSGQDTSARLTLRAPFAGTLVTRKAVVGEAVNMGHELFTLANLSEFWLELSIPPNTLGQAAIGQYVEAHFDELAEAPVTGRISWIDTAVNPETRMVRARAVVQSEGRRLSVGLFGKAHIAVGQSQVGTILPEAAVQQHEGADFIFIRSAPDLYALRRVEVGNRRDGKVEIVRGLAPGEPVVVDGSFIAMSEFLKSRLGAGCVH